MKEKWDNLSSKWESLMRVIVKCWDRSVSGLSGITQKCAFPFPRISLLLLPRREDGENRSLNQ